MGVSHVHFLLQKEHGRDADATRLHLVCGFSDESKGQPGEGFVAGKELDGGACEARGGEYFCRGTTGTAANSPEGSVIGAKCRWREGLA